MQDCECTAKVRALESHDVAKQQKANNKAAMAKTRASTITVKLSVSFYQR